MNRFVPIAFFLCLVTACSSMMPRGDRGNPSGLPVSFLDDNVARAILILNHRAERLPSGHLSIAITCKGANENQPVVVDWKVVFSDARGMPSDETEWHTEYLPAGETKQLQAGSIRTDCTAFQVQFRTPAPTGRD